jgi:hypothetical protein
MITNINEFKVYLNENVDMSTFSIIQRSDGIISKYGQENNLDIDDCIENLIYYNIISDNYTEDELRILLNNLKLNQTHTFGSRWTQTEVTKTHSNDTLLENVRIPQEVELKFGVKYKNINWNDLNLINVGVYGDTVFYGIQIPGENNKYNKGIIVDLKNEDELNRIDIMMDFNLQGLGLGYKIYKKIIEQTGHIYSLFNKRVNDDAIPKIWEKLKNDSDIEVHSNKDGEIAIWKNMNDNELKNNLISKINNK